MSTSSQDGAIFGLLAEFDTPRELYHACETVRDAGYKQWDAHSPFPVHGLEKAMGLKPSVLPWIVLGGGLTGASCALLLQWWVSAVAYPLVIAGKPFFSWQAFVPICFELMILFAAFSCFFGMLVLNGLPQLYHSLFRSERFQQATNNKFFISVEAGDPNFDAESTTSLLQKAGATHVEMVEQ